jgi:hypothetical protein
VPAATLVHSPLVGPATWGRAAEVLRELGWPVAVPDLRPAAASGRWDDVVAAAVAGGHAEPDGVLVAHSGAGALLPAVAAALPHRPAALVFVDAVLPPATGEVALVPPAFLDHLRDLAVDGLLPPWADWFGPDAMAEQVPDAARRAEALADLPRLPLAWFLQHPTVPDGWAATPAAYVRLSGAYDDEAADARARGWPVAVLDRTHLAAVTHPREVADAIAAAVEQLLRR